MAIRIPIITEFNGKGIQKATREFKQLDGALAKTRYAVKKSLLPMTAAVGGLAAGLADAVKAAMDDQAAQANLAKVLVKSAKATDAQVAANEDWISTQGALLGVTDDELRPAMAGLVRVTKSIPKAQRAASIAMDIAAQKGLKLSTVTTALERAYGGNTKALVKLAPELKGVIKEGATTEEIMKRLTNIFGGAAANAANTTAGRMKRLAVAFDEAKESLGELFLPLLEKILPKLQQLADWAKKNPDKFRKIATAIGLVTAALWLLNWALAANPIVLGVVAVMAFAAAWLYVYDRFEMFRTAVDWWFGKLASGAKAWASAWKNAFLGAVRTIRGALNFLIRGWNSIEFKLPSFAGLKIAGKSVLPSWEGPTIGTPDIPEIPALAKGGIVNSPTLAMIGEAGPEAVVPLSDSNRFGTTINIYTGVGDPVAIGREVKRVLAAANRRAA